MEIFCDIPFRRTVEVISFRFRKINMPFQPVSIPGFKCREVNRMEQVRCLPNNERAELFRRRRHTFRWSTFNSRSLVIPVHWEIARIVETPRTIIFFCPKENRWIVDVTTSPATGPRKARRRRETVTVFRCAAFFEASERRSLYRTSLSVVVRNRVW